MKERHRNPRSSGVSDSPLGHRAPFIWLLLPFTIGLVGAKIAPGELPSLALTAIALGFVLIAAALALRHPTGWSIALTCGLISSGAAYYELRRDRLPAWDELPPREASVTARITRVFHSGLPGRFSGVAVIQATEPHLHELVRQQVALSLQLGAGHSAPIRGSTVNVIGLIESLPRRPSADPFIGYLVNRGTNFRLTRGRLLEAVEPAGPYARWRARMYDRASVCLGVGLEQHPYLAAALRGMLLGERHGLNDDQRDLYLRSGAMHLFAISGLHIGVIAGGVIAILRLIRLPPLARFLVGSSILWLYVDLTGALPSAVRAWLMVVCFHGSLVLRAPGNPVAALTVSAFLVLMLDPMQLFGPGFQMSYAIVAALLLYGLPLRLTWIDRTLPWKHLPVVSQSWWQRATARGWQAVLGAGAISLAAALVGMVSGVAFFELLTPTAVLVNVLLVPLATVAILAGFLSLFTGLIGLTPLGLLFNHAAGVLLVLMQGILERITALPLASLPAQFRTPWLGSAAIAAFVSLFIWSYGYRWRVPGGFWLPFLLLAGVLLFGVRLL